MYESITSYLDFFEKNDISETELQKKAEEFSEKFAQSEFMNPNAMEAMGERILASKSSLKADAPSMTSEQALVCLSAFVQQNTFIPGIVPDLIQQGVIPEILKRLKELDA